MHKPKVSVKQEADQKPKKRQDRKRYLNVIYFIDSRRTRTLKFGIGTSYLVVSALSLAVIWSIVASTLLIRDRFIIASMSAHSRSLLETVFNYQTRYDEVYEKAYPNSEGVVPTLVESDATEFVPSLDSTAELALKTAKSAHSETAKVGPPTNAIARERTRVEKIQVEFPIGIDNFASTLLGKNLTIRLSLKNLKSPSKVAGSISGLVKFIDTSGQTHTIPGRPTQSGDEDDHFNIRYFKNKNLLFESPKDLAGTFAEVTITIRDDQGHSKDFTYKVNKDLPATPANQSPLAIANPTPDPRLSKTEEPVKGPLVKANDIEADKEPTDTIDGNMTSSEGNRPQTGPN